MNPLTAFALATAVGVSFVAVAADIETAKLPPPSTKENVTFDKDIKPMFEKSCVGCHGAEKPKGKLRLDTLEGTLKGSVDGKVLEPGKSASSFLVSNIAYIGDEEDFMPPPKDAAKYPQLTPEQIGLVRAWIDQGAK